MQNLTVGSICSGIEAATVAWQPIGFKFNWYSEIAAFQASLLKEKYPDTVNIGDMSLIADKIKAGEISTCDIICGGTPCQAFSLAGVREGLGDERGNLTLKFVDIVEANDAMRKSLNLEPCLAFWENVEGVLSDKTNAFGCLIYSLSGLKEELKPEGKRWKNYGFIQGDKRAVAWRVLDAKYFGLPQQRRRLYLVAGANGEKVKRILFEPLKDDKSINFEYNNPLEFTKEGHKFQVFRSYTDCLYASYGTKWNGNAAAYNGSLFVVQDDKLRRLSPFECERLMGFPDNYTNISKAKRTNRYRAIGNSWAVPVVRWIGERIAKYFNEAKVEVRDLADLNTSDKPNEVVLGNLKDIVSPISKDEDILYLSSKGCAGILRRAREGNTKINKDLENLLREEAKRVTMRDHT